MTAIDLSNEAKKKEAEQDYASAATIYQQLWKEREDAYYASRGSYCLRKAGQPAAALNLVHAALQKYPHNKYLRQEAVWAIYDTEFKPAKEQENVRQLIQAGQKIIRLTQDNLPIRLITFPIISLAKSKGKWDIVEEWCRKIDPQTLSDERRKIGDRMVLSEREQWYFAWVKSLVQLQRWEQAREWAQKAHKEYPRERDFIRWGAQALAALGQVERAIVELEPLLDRRNPDWFVFQDMAELQAQKGDLDKAYELACLAALAKGEDKAKVSLFAFIAQIALKLENPGVAYRQVQLARYIRRTQGWSEPSELARLAHQAQMTMEKKGQVVSELPCGLPDLRKLCYQDWKQVVSRRSLMPSVPSSINTEKPWEGVDVQTGKIKTYNDERGFGFIIPDNGHSDIFFHIKDTLGIHQPKPGMIVEFHVKEGEKGLRAIEVRLRVDYD